MLVSGVLLVSWWSPRAAGGVLAVMVAVSWALAGLPAVVLVVRGSPDRHAPCGGLSPLANPCWLKANLLDACVCLQRAAVRGC